jgi:hypothetical protein
MTARGGEETREMTKELAMKERVVKLKLAELELSMKSDQFEKDLAEKKRVADRLHRTSKVSERDKRTFAEVQAENEMQRLGISNDETYLAATRFVHDQRIAEVELLRSFSDRLLGNTDRERLFALLVLSAYVNPEVIGRLADGGNEIIPTANLKTLAELKGEIALVAKSALARREPAGPDAKKEIVQES